MGRGEPPVTTNTINQILDYLSLAPFFYSALLSVSSQEESNDDSQGMAVALMDLIDGVLGGCQRPGRPTSFCSPHRGLHRLHRTGGHRLSLPSCL